MKHLFLSTALLLAAASAYAQTAPGTVLLNGGIGYSSDKMETPATQYTPAINSENKQFSFTPRVGVFVANNLAVGLQGGFESSELRQPQAYYPGSGWLQPTYTTLIRKITAFQVGPFVRYYQMVGEKAGFYGQLAGGYGKQKTKTSYDNMSSAGDTYEAKGGFADITPGFVFFPTDKFGLELTLGSLGYSSMKEKLTDPAVNTAPETKMTSLQARFGLSQLMLGASFHLGGK